MKKMKDMGIEVVKQRHIVGTEPHPTLAGAVLGSHEGIPDRFANSQNILLGSASTSSRPVPAKFAKSITMGISDTDMPDWVKPHVTMAGSAVQSEGPPAPTARRSLTSATASKLQKTLAQRRISQAGSTADDAMEIDDDVEEDDDEAEEEQEEEEEEEEDQDSLFVRG